MDKKTRSPEEEIEALLAEKVEATLKKGAHKIQEAIDHAAKYPEATKFADKAPQRFHIMGFLEWLQEEHELDIATVFVDHQSARNEPVPLNLSNEGLVNLYHGIDAKELREERRAMEQEQQRKAQEK